MIAKAKNTKVVDAPEAAKDEKQPKAEKVKALIEAKQIKTGSFNVSDDGNSLHIIAYSKTGQRFEKLVKLEGSKDSIDIVMS